MLHRSNIVISHTVCRMGQLESSYSKLGTGCAKSVLKEEVDGGVKTDKKKQRKSKGKKESLFHSISWKGRRNMRTSMSDWPAWYHGWCRRTEVKKKLMDGPQGLLIMKNFTEFPGDLTRCLACDGKPGQRKTGFITLSH